MRNRALIRCLRMIDRLKRRRATLAQLAAEYHVTARTIRRDLDALVRAGIPLKRSADGLGFEHRFWWVER